MALLRFGRANSQLLIERDRRNLCHYETEVGSLTLGVTGDGIDCKLTEKGGGAAFSHCWTPTTPASSKPQHAGNDGTAIVSRLLIVFACGSLRKAGFALKHEKDIE